MKPYVCIYNIYIYTYIHYITLHYIKLHSITLQYNTIHTYIHTHLRAIFDMLSSWLHYWVAKLQLRNSLSQSAILARRFNRSPDLCYYLPLTALKDWKAFCLFASQSLNRLRLAIWIVRKLSHLLDVPLCISDFMKKNFPVDSPCLNQASEVITIAVPTVKCLEKPIW